MVTDDKNFSQLFEAYPRRKVALLVSHLNQAISANKLSFDDVRLNARDLSKDYDISEVTAHKVLRQLGKHKSTGNSAASRNKIFRVGVFINSLVEEERHFNYSEEHYNIDRDSAVRRLKELDIEPVLFTTQMLYDDSIESFDGFLTKSLPIDLEERMFGRKIPVVICQVGSYEPSRTHSIIPELGNSYLEVLHLWPEDGAPVIAAGIQARVSKERIENFLFYAERSGRDMSRIESRVVPMLGGDLGQLAGYKFGRQLAKAAGKVRILSVSDYFSFGIIDAFNEAGWTPGKNYELVSIDNQEGMGQCPFGKPMLSSIDIRLSDLFAAGADLMAEVLKSPPPPEQLLSRRILSKLVRRDTA